MKKDTNLRKVADTSYSSMLPSSLRLDTNAQQEYLDRYRVTVETLPSEAILLSANRVIPDVQYTEVKARFRVGANDDPEGLDGLSHFAEHMVFNGCKYAPSFQDQVMKAEFGGYQLNGETNRWSTLFDLGGSSGLTNDSFGIIPGNNHLISMITEPTLSKESFEKEKGVIFDEMKRTFSSLGYLNIHQIFRCVFPKDHPMQKYTVGNENTFEKINLDTIKSQIKRYYVPRNSLISILSDGDPEKHINVVKRIKEEWISQFPSSKDEVGNEFPGMEILSSVKHFKESDKMCLQTKVRENRVLVSIAMVDRIAPFSRDEFALNMALNTLEREIFHTLRRKGYGYSSVFETSTLPLSGVGVLVVGMQVERELYKNLAKEIKSLFAVGIKRIIDERLCDQAVERERLRQLDVPISMSTRVSHIIKGLREYKQVIKSDDVRKIALSVRSDDVRKMLERFVELPKGLFICGDY